MIEESDFCAIYYRVNSARFLFEEFFKNLPKLILRKSGNGVYLLL